MLKDIYSNVLVMSLAYVISAGAFCEWCWIARQASLVSLTSYTLDHILCQSISFHTLQSEVWSQL